MNKSFKVFFSDGITVLVQGSSPNEVLSTVKDQYPDKKNTVLFGS